MPRKKSTDTPQEKALRKLLLSLGLSTVTANRLIRQMSEHLADLSAKACDVQLYINGHPEVRNPAGYAAATLLNFAEEQNAPTVPTVPTAPTAPTNPSPSAPTVMPLWGTDD